MYQINIVFPCFNPPETWKEEFIAHCNQLITSLLHYEIKFIIVNDGSKRGFERHQTEWLQNKLPNLIIINHPANQGKGQAIRTGISYCENGFIIYCDTDFPFGIEPFQQIITQLENGDQVVFGNRDQSYHQKLPFLRRTISVLFQLVNRIIIPSTLSGCQAGILGFQEQIKPWFLKTTINRFLFSTEFARIVYKKKIKFSTIPLTLRDIDPHSTINKKSMLQEFSNLLYLITGIRRLKY